MVSTVAVVGVDIARMPFGEYLVKAVDRGTLLTAVQVLAARSEYDEGHR